MRKRAKTLLDKAYKKYPNGTVLFSGHGGVNKILITLILGKPPVYIKQLGHLNNTAVCIFEIKEDKKHIIHLLNCTRHLNSFSQNI